jgi:hypothetical protein
MASPPGVPRWARCAIRELYAKLHVLEGKVTSLADVLDTPDEAAGDVVAGNSIEQTGGKRMVMVALNSPDEVAGDRLDVDVAIGHTVGKEILISGKATKQSVGKEIVTNVLSKPKGIEGDGVIAGRAADQTMGKDLVLNMAKAAAGNGAIAGNDTEQTAVKESARNVLGSGSTQATKDVDWLFTNAPRYYGDVGDLAEFASSLAETDAWGAHDWHGGGGADNAMLEALASSVQVRSPLDDNLQPVPPSFSNSSVKQEGSRPLMRDVEQLSTRRREEMAVHLEAIGPQALGAAGAVPALFLRTLPFVDLMLTYSRGNHPKLRFLPHSMMHAIKDLIESYTRP